MQNVIIRTKYFNTLNVEILIDISISERFDLCEQVVDKEFLEM